jgi:phosphopantothenoylcysteine decarboxylase/phosphopantothenate--cysteine ligase
MRILVTSGATREFLDDVRFVSNVSTGRTGALLADALARAGLAVTLLRGQGADKPPRPDALAGLSVFTSADNLLRQLRARLAAGKIDAVIHCAAVSDYRPEKKIPGKLPSSSGSLDLHLVPTRKILPLLKGFSPCPLVVIGFKLTAGATETRRKAAVAGLFASGTVDYVVHNDLDDRAADGDLRAFRVHSPQKRLATLRGLPRLAGWLVETLR